MQQDIEMRFSAGPDPRCKGKNTEGIYCTPDITLLATFKPGIVKLENNVQIFTRYFGKDSAIYHCKYNLDTHQFTAIARTCLNVSTFEAEFSSGEYSCTARMELPPVSSF